MPSPAPVPATEAPVAVSEIPRRVEQVAAVPAPQTVEAEAEQEFGRAEELIETTADLAGNPIDVPEVEEVMAEEDQQEAYFQAVFSGASYSGEYELQRLTGRDAGTDGIDNFILKEKRRRYDFSKPPLTVEEAIKLRRQLADWQQSGFDATLIKDYHNQCGLPSEVRNRRGSVHQIRSLVFTDTREKMVQGIVEGRIETVDGIGLTEAEERMIRQQTVEKQQKIQKKAEQKKIQQKLLGQENLEPLIEGQVWEIVTHAPDKNRQADSLLTPDKTVLLKYREGGLQAKAELLTDPAAKLVEVPSNSGELHDEVRDELKKIGGDMTVILAGSDLRGCDQS